MKNKISNDIPHYKTIMAAVCCGIFGSIVYNLTFGSGSAKDVVLSFFGYIVIYAIINIIITGLIKHIEFWGIQASE